MLSVKHSLEINCRLSVEMYRKGDVTHLHEDPYGTINHGFKCESLGALTAISGGLR